MGDHLGDLQMADGLDHKVCLTIGYLNDKGNTCCGGFPSKYVADIVLTAALDPHTKEVYLK